MFTGLITDIGTLVRVSKSKIFSARISCNYNYSETSEGASICHDGVCLTIFNKRKEEKGFSYEVEVSNETIQLTFEGEVHIPINNFGEKYFPISQEASEVQKCVWPKCPRKTTAPPPISSDNTNFSGTCDSNSNAIATVPP